jgi:hypothetical protein
VTGPAWLGSKAPAPCETAAPASEADKSEMPLMAWVILSLVKVSLWILSRYGIRNGHVDTCEARTAARRGGPQWRLGGYGLQSGRRGQRRGRRRTVRGAWRGGQRCRRAARAAARQGQAAGRRDDGAGRGSR